MKKILFVFAVFTTASFASEKSCTEVLNDNNFRLNAIYQCQVKSITEGDRSVLPESTNKLCIGIGEDTEKNVAIINRFQSNTTYLNLYLYEGEFGMTKTSVKNEDNNLIVKSVEKMTMGGFFPTHFRSTNVLISKLDQINSKYSFSQEVERVGRAKELDFSVEAVCTKE